MSTTEFENEEANEKASDPTLTRQEFLLKIVKAAAIAGGVLAAPKVIDKFLVPPALASSSTGLFTDSSCAAGDVTAQGPPQGDQPTFGGSDVQSVFTGDTYCETLGG